MAKKTIWIIGEAGPIEGENWRDYRSNQFGKYLSQYADSDVVWWTANFAHHFKRYRSKGWKDIKVNNNFTIRLVPTTSYKKNFGFGRLLSIFVFTFQTGRRMKMEKKPDVIIGNSVLTKGYPIFSFAKKHNVAIIVDQGDIWPEFIEMGFGKLSKIAHFLFTPIYKAREKNYADATAIIALGKNYLHFAQSIAPNGFEKPCALVYNGIDIDQFNKMAKLDLPPKIEKKIDKKDREILCIFAGTFGPSYDISTMLKCAAKIDESGLPIKFVLAGSGPRISEVEEMALKHKNIIYVGALKPSELIPLYTKCDIGLCPYTKKSNVDMPDKFYDYTAAGLAIVNSLTQEVADRIVQSKAGLNYQANDVDDMFKQIKTIVTDQDLMKEMKENSKALSVEFDAKKQNKKLADLIDIIIEGKK